MGGKGATLPVTLLLVASILDTIPSYTAASRTISPNETKASTPPPPVGTSRGRPSSAVFPLHGKIFPDQAFFATMNIGNPQGSYSLDIDTGSGVTWVKCSFTCMALGNVYPKPSKDKLIPCDDPLCRAVHAATRQEHKCLDPRCCDYRSRYLDNSFSDGVLIRDTFAIRLTNGTTVHLSVAFGCGYRQVPEPSRADGMVGLSSDKISLVSQMSSQGVIRNVVGHCISGKGRGFLFLGDEKVPSSGVTWVPRVTEREYDSPGKATIALGKQPLGSRHGVVIDSGTGYTYFLDKLYRDFLSAITRDIASQPLVKAIEGGQAESFLCWKGPKPFQSVLDAEKYFESLLLKFDVRGAELKILPRNYLVISPKRNVCLGILNGTEHRLEVNVFGDISVQDLMVINDNEKKRIGWIKANCDNFLQSETSTGDLRKKSKDWWFERG